MKGAFSALCSNKMLISEEPDTMMIQFRVQILNDTLFLSHKVDAILLLAHVDQMTILPSTPLAGKV